MTDSFAIVYNTVTHRNETVKIARELPDGSTKVLPNGDTMYWIGGDCYGEGEYVSSEEWKEYVKK